MRFSLALVTLICTGGLALAQTGGGAGGAGAGPLVADRRAERQPLQALVRAQAHRPEPQAPRRQQFSVRCR
jgi:hypothetical protein